MKVYAKIFAYLTRSISAAILAQHPEGIRAGTALEVELPNNSTLTDLVTYLGLPQEEIKIIFVNGRARKPDYRLAPGDEVGIFPPIAGG